MTPVGYPFFSDNEWIEVLHQKDPWHDEAHGMWLLYAKGSGIWFNVGKTLKVADHQDAYMKLSNLRYPNLTLGDVDGYGNDVNFYYDGYGNRRTRLTTDEMLSVAACANGIASVQFNNHLDNGNYPTCQYSDTTRTYLNIEILATCFSGTYACGVAGDGRGNPFKAGWHNKPCKCTNDADVLNCGHHTSAGSSSRRRASPTPSSSTASPSTAPPSIMIV